MICIVDDYSAICKGVAMLLRANGHECECFLDPCAALAFMKRQKPSLLLLDLMMPAMHGVEVLRQIRTDPTLSDLPVILMSAAADELHIAEAQLLGVKAVLSKTELMWDDLPRMVTALVGIARPVVGGAR